MNLYNQCKQAMTVSSVPNHSPSTSLSLSVSHCLILSLSLFLSPSLSLSLSLSPSLSLFHRHFVNGRLSEAKARDNLTHQISMTMLLLSVSSKKSCVALLCRQAADASFPLWSRSLSAALPSCSRLFKQLLDADGCRATPEV